MFFFFYNKEYTWVRFLYTKTKFISSIQSKQAIPKKTKQQKKDSWEFYLLKYDFKKLFKVMKSITEVAGQSLFQLEL